MDGRLRRGCALIIGFAFLAALPACSLFGSDKKDRAAAEQAEAVAASYEPIEAVRDLELGRTRDGYVVQATGLAPRAGYTLPQLRPRRDGQPDADGYLDFDFVALPPHPSLNLGTGSLAARTLLASVQLNEKDLANVRGVRVHTLSDSLQMDF